MNHIASRVGHKETAWATVDFAESLAGQTDGRRVDDGQQFGEITVDYGVEQCLAGVLQLAQIDVAAKIRVFAGQRLMRPPDLGLHFVDMGWQEPKQTECVALFIGEGCAFV